MSNRLFWQNHLIIPLIAFALLAWLFEQRQLDLVVADWLYQLEGGRWALRRSFIFSTILHHDAAQLVKIMALFILVLAVASSKVAKLKPYRQGLWYLALALPVSTLLVGAGKILTHVDCPWDLLRYGGDHPYLKLFEMRTESQSGGRCFPAGHASGGYTMVAFYFFFLQIKPSWRFYGLGIGLACGLLFGITQQMRGAHFISHDLWTLAICWLNSLVWYLIFFKNKGLIELNATTTYRQGDYD